MSSIAIIGAGLGGLALALCLHSHNVPCTIYEQSPSSTRFSGAIMLSPNSLRILDTLGVYSRLQPQGFNFESCELKNDAGETTDRYWLGNQRLFGYDCLRIYRNLVVKELQEVVRERGMEIVFDAKYSHIVSETEKEGVEFAFTDGRTATASILVGADGIHSRVRRYIAPGVEPLYNGIVAVVGAVKRAKLTIPDNEAMKGPLMYPSEKAGMFLLAPQDVDGSEIMAGTQMRHSQQDREGWARFAADKDALRAFLKTDIEVRPEIVRTAIEGIDLESIYIWPQHTLPRLDTWVSEKRRVIIMGDAAHTIPPTTGQGGGQAIEDALTLSMLLSFRLQESGSEMSFPAALASWQTSRQARVDKLVDLTSKMNNLRLPKEERAKLDSGEVWKDEDRGKGDGSSMAWLFMPDLKDNLIFSNGQT